LRLDTTPEEGSILGGLWKAVADSDYPFKPEFLYGLPRGISSIGNYEGDIMNSKYHDYINVSVINANGDHVLTTNPFV